MRTIVLLFVAIFAISSCSSLGQQNYASHQVKEGETATAIASKYNITIYELYRLNPEAKGNLYPGLVLVLPSKAKPPVPTVATDADYVLYTVKKGDNLFNLSQRFDVTQSEIKKYNTELYAASLKVGQEIKIPKTTEASKDSSISRPTGTNRKHIVKAKETKYGLAAMYGITIAELEKLNPEIKEGLKIGAILNVPDENFSDSAVLEEGKFSFYEVQAQENFFRLTKKLNMTKEELLALNPSLQEGLKAGMVLKLPKDVVAKENAEEGRVFNLADRLNNTTPKNIALLMPFDLSAVQIDTADVRAQTLKRNRVMRISLDFYSGALGAVDSAKALGLTTNLEIFDTDFNQTETAIANRRKVDELLRSEDFEKFDAVIGPLLGANVSRVSQSLARAKTPVISPITSQVDLLDNLFQARPTQEVLQAKMFEYITASAQSKNVVIIADTKHERVKNKLIASLPGARVVPITVEEDNMFLYAKNLTNVLVGDKENWVIVESNNVPLISSILSALITEYRDKKISMLTTAKGSAYESNDISNSNLMRLNFTFPSVEKPYEDVEGNSFVSKYKSTYGILPNSYAVRGFDVTFDTLLRLGASGDLYAAAAENWTTRYVESKFNYVNKLSSGFYNNAAFILRYGEDLTLEEVVVPSDIDGNTLKD
ncbi:MAG: LysM peptidoglycan-binding domain-containing protein [Leeuwenhoekiella sp.]